MDLQAFQLASGKRWSLAKLAVFLCFAAACALLIGSLLMPSRAKAAIGVSAIDQAAFTQLSRSD
jgi:hypothetical protein